MQDHGYYGYRLRPNAYGTTECVGFSKWHLLAARMLSLQQAGDFLVSASEQDTNTLLDDIRESMAVFPSRYRGSWTENATYKAGWTWASFRAASAWRSPIEICHLIGLPLVPRSLNEKIRLGLHPVIKAAHTESCRRLGLCPDEVGL